MFLLIIVLFISILLLYIYKYFSSSQQISFLQTSISNIHLSHLLEKNPIIISESIVNPSYLLSTLFKYLYIKTYTNQIDDTDFHLINSKYLILFSENPVHIELYHPKFHSYLKKNTEHSLKYTSFIDIHLNKNQVLILPMFWWFRVNNCQKINTIAIYDILSFIYQKFI